jgi:hypothetical protein
MKEEELRNGEQQKKGKEKNEEKSIILLMKIYSPWLCEKERNFHGFQYFSFLFFPTMCPITLEFHELNRSVDTRT